MECGYCVFKEWLIVEYRGMKCLRYDIFNFVDLEIFIYFEYN